jgi:hypothetical protein
VEKEGGEDEGRREREVGREGIILKICGEAFLIIVVDSSSDLRSTNHWLSSNLLVHLRNGWLWWCGSICGPARDGIPCSVSE